MKKAYFAGGCFWCIAPVFREMEGVGSVISGYCGGDEEDPSYADVKAQKTHHRETICVEYDPEKVSYQDLLSVFLESVDPFDAGGQFIDRGASYTLAVFCSGDDERRLSENMLENLSFNIPYLLTRLKYLNSGKKDNKYYDFLKNIKVDFE